MKAGWTTEEQYYAVTSVLDFDNISNYQTKEIRKGTVRTDIQRSHTEYGSSGIF